MTLGQLRSKVYAQLREDDPAVVTSNPNTHFTDPSTINGFLNEAMEFAAVFIEYPRDLVAVTALSNVGSYPNPSDNLLVRTAYFGSESIAGDIKPVKIVSEETLREYYPSWLDQTVSQTADRPEYMIQLDRKTVHIIPRPNQDAINKSRKLWINYNYVPTAMSNDSDVPDLPVPYHNLLVFYALHLCYLSLEKPELAKEMYAEFMEKINRIKSAVTKEAKEGLSMSWGMEIDVDVSDGGIGF